MQSLGYWKKYKKEKNIKKMGEMDVTSFADVNRRILKAGKSQYNNTGNRAENGRTSSVYGMHSAPSVSGMSKKSVSNQRRDAVSAAIERRKKYIKKRNEKFSASNREKIREAFASGTSKTDYSYEEYTVKEHNFPIGLAAAAFAFTIVAVFLLLNYSQISKYNDRINALKSEMEAYNEEVKELDILLDKKTDLAAIEDFAEENGMVGSEQIEYHYISMSDSFKIEKTDDTEQEYTVSTVMSGVIKLFSEALGG